MFSTLPCDSSIKVNFEFAGNQKIDLWKLTATFFIHPIRRNSNSKAQIIWKPSFGPFSDLIWKLIKSKIGSRFLFTDRLSLSQTQENLVAMMMNNLCVAINHTTVVVASRHLANGTDLTWRSETSITQGTKILQISRSSLSGVISSS